MRKDIPLDELGDFVTLPIASVLATYRRDGGVLLSPVWHRWRDGGFDVTCFPGDIKVKHLENDPRASLLIHDQVPPYRGVEIRTNAVLFEIDAREFDPIAVHYLGEEAGLAYAGQVTGNLILVRLEPGTIRTWDFEDDF
jgi:Pyridoxamine 5'-phosphate oxidase